LIFPCHAGGGDGDSWEGRRPNFPAANPNIELPQLVHGGCNASKAPHSLVSTVVPFRVRIQKPQEDPRYSQPLVQRYAELGNRQLEGTPRSERTDLAMPLEMLAGATAAAKALAPTACTTIEEVGSTGVGALTLGFLALAVTTVVMVAKVMALPSPPPALPGLI
jgi:hypothetical protein